MSSHGFEGLVRLMRRDPRDLIRFSPFLGPFLDAPFRLVASCHSDSEYSHVTVAQTLLLCYKGTTRPLNAAVVLYAS